VGWFRDRLGACHCLGASEQGKRRNVQIEAFFLGGSAGSLLLREI
jgi:hypothetical protein